MPDCGPTHHDACPCREAKHREEIARLTRERDAARAECRAWAVLDRTRSMFERYLLSPRGPTAADVRAAEEALTKARAANQMENTQ